MTAPIGGPPAGTPGAPASEAASRAAATGAAAPGGAVARAFDLYRRTGTSRSALLLVAANAVPLAGVLFFGWSLWTILVLYWIENGIVGLWNIPKILLAQGSIVPMIPDLPPEEALRATATPAQATALRDAWRQARAARDAQAQQVAAAGLRIGALFAVGRTVLAGFFLVHYGVFWVVHGVFVMVLPTFLGGATGLGGGTGLYTTTGIGAGLGDASGLGGVGLLGQGGAAFGEINWSSVWIAAAALFLSHGASFLFNYIGRGEYRTASPTAQMAAPYGRVVILHLTIIFGAFVVAFVGAPIGALVILVALKTAFDLGLHLRERRTAGARPRSRPSSAGAPDI